MGDLPSELRLHVKRLAGPHTETEEALPSAFLDMIKAADRIEALEEALRDAAGALHGAADVFQADGNDSAAETAQEMSGRARAVLEDK